MPIRTVYRRISSAPLIEVVKVGVMVLCVSSLVAEFVLWVRLP